MGKERETKMLFACARYVRGGSNDSTKNRVEGGKRQEPREKEKGKKTEKLANEADRDAVAARVVWSERERERERERR